MSDDPLDFSNLQPREGGTEIINYPTTVPPQQFRAAVLAAGLVWAANGGQIRPTSLLIQATVLKNYSLKVLDKILATDEFAAEMARKGIRWNDLSPLSDKQILALQSITSPTGGTLQTKLKRLGISATEYSMWKRDPIFKAHLTQLTQDMLTAYREEIDTALVEGSLDGKLEHIKYLNELTGRHDPQKKTQLDVEHVIMSILEIISRHVTNSHQLDAIARDIIGLTGAAPTLSLKEQVINGYNDNN